jgi:hypothetical protein
MAEELSLAVEVASRQPDNTGWGFHKDQLRRGELGCIDEALDRIHPRRDPVHALLHSLVEISNGVSGHPKRTHVFAPFQPSSSPSSWHIRLLRCLHL